MLYNGAIDSELEWRRLLWRGGFFDEGLEDGIYYMRIPKLCAGMVIAIAGLESRIACLTALSTNAQSQAQEGQTSLAISLSREVGIGCLVVSYAPRGLGEKELTAVEVEVIFDNM